MPRALAAALLLTASLMTHADGSALDADELAALTAALDQTHHPDNSGWLLIDAQTATFACDPGQPHVINLDGCSGMTRPGQDPGEMLGFVKEAIPTADDAAIADLKAKCAASVAVGQPLGVQTKQVLWNPADPSGFPSDLGKPMAALNLSRVGFAADRTRALLYIGSMNYSDRSQSYGEYVYLTKADGKWTVQGTMQSWKIGK